MTDAYVENPTPTRPSTPVTLNTTPESSFQTAGTDADGLDLLGAGAQMLKVCTMSFLLVLGTEG